MYNRQDTKMPEKTRTTSSGDSESELNYDLFNSSINSDNASIMNSSQISTTSGDSQYKTNINSASGASCRFPKLEECAHFHYERVQLGKLSVHLVVDDRLDGQMVNASIASQCLDTSSQGNRSPSYILKVHTGHLGEPYMIKRSFDNIRFLDEMLHRCVYDRRISELCSVKDVDMSLGDNEVEQILESYFNRLSVIASDSITCGPILTWLQLDNKGRRLPVADVDTMRSINTPAVGAAYGVRRYVAQACDEISIEVGDMISIIDMPSPAESIWWRGKKSHLQKNQYEVGFFPQSCVATIGDKVPRHMPLPAPLVGSLALSPTKPVLRKHGKLIAFFRSFILARPSRRRLKQSGIYKERVFSCDLGEHLLNSGQDIPMVLKCCAEFIEEYGIVDGIYRLSGITSNIQKLRRAFDEERIPDLSHPDIKQDIHAVSSLLKMYFRELPNPLCTYQLYDHFVNAIQAKADGEIDMKLRLIRQTVRKLPPPHYRTLKYLATHLFKISGYSKSTGMTERNIAIVWAPNLLRSPALEAGGVAALRGVGVQAVVTEYLISRCESIFDDTNDDFGDLFNNDSQPNSLSDTNSIQIDPRDNDLSLSIERPKSLSVGGAKLLSLEEARIQQSMKGNDKSMPINITNPLNTTNSYIEVGGGPSSLPDKYHTVLPVPRSWNKRKSNTSWKSIFSRAPRQSNSNHDMKAYLESVEAKEVDKDNVTKTDQIAATKMDAINGNLDKITKSIDTFDAKSHIVDSCIRSNSVDSLRTSGHSRSVSHDSYFDLLQSPLRGVTTCPSKEFSELGLNFDREEPEMRIFSESESLVSSPKVAKESVRRTLRARPDEYPGYGNSVNPSPKKQPRLNIQSPKESKWTSNNQNDQSHQDESVCKRYKLEDQLSDIQFIDCSTPEHVVTAGLNSNTIFTSAQIHKIPADIELRESFRDGDMIGTRNSYPSTQYAYVKYDSPIKETRYSFPGVSAKADNTTKKHLEGNNNVQSMNDPEIAKEDCDRLKKCPNNTHTTTNTGRHSYYQNEPYENQSDVQVVPRSCSEDVIRKNEMHKSKLSIMTPQSPLQSPCYSLLVGSTSSDNSSVLNTPVYDVDFSNTISSEDKIKEMNSIKKELSLDLLDNKDSKIFFDHMSSNAVNLTKAKCSSPNTPNFTSDNTTTTSQSMTPSEFCYQHLNLENSPIIEAVEQTFQSFTSKNKPTTPIKATISITYNIRSPVKKEQSDNIFRSPRNSGSSTPTSKNDYENVQVTSSPKKLLETNFDETMVYEQVKFFRNAITEINDLVKESSDTEKEDEENQNGNGDIDQSNNSAIEASQVVPDLELNNDDYTENVDNKQTTYQIPTFASESDNDDVPMSDINEDSLEFDRNEELIYENIELRKKSDDEMDDPSDLSLYENVNLRKSSSGIYENVDIKANSMEKPLKIELKPIHSISVKQLAIKFETSPVSDSPNSDFSQQQNQKRPTSVTIRSKPAKENQNIGNITRSLDENAFVREFGSAKKLEAFTNFNKSSHQIQEIDNILNENNTNRRKSLEVTKPKMLNPPKKLPTLVSDDPDGTSCCRKTEMNLDLSTKIEDAKEIRGYNVRITPTTENRISLVQYNNYESDKKKDSSDDNKSLTSLKVLGSCKLDRSRIEKIKEERRHQLSEKYRSESFKCDKEYGKQKSKSKTELREAKETDDRKFDSLRYKSKSRVELSDTKPFSLDNNSKFTSASLTTVATSSEDKVAQLNNPKSTTTARTRRISDEKNQNDCILTSTADASITQVCDSKFELKTRQKFDKKGALDFSDREKDTNVNFNDRNVIINRNSQSAQRNRYSPQISIKDVAAIFESRSQNQ